MTECFGGRLICLLAAGWRVASWLIVTPLICPLCTRSSSKWLPFSPAPELNTGPVSSLGVERDFLLLRSHDRQPEGRRLWLGRSSLSSQDLFLFKTVIVAAILELPLAHPLSTPNAFRRLFILFYFFTPFAAWKFCHRIFELLGIQKSHGSLCFADY